VECPAAGDGVAVEHARTVGHDLRQIHVDAECHRQQREHRQIHQRIQASGQREFDKSDTV
jgi:hypothetical protein